MRATLAREIMGWREATIPWAYSDAAAVWQDSDGRSLHPLHAWRPDEDPRQSDDLVERMVVLGFTLEVRMDQDGCDASFERAGKRAHAIASERTLAIALAAHAAVAGAMGPPGGSSR